MGWEIVLLRHHYLIKCQDCRLKAVQSRFKGGYKALDWSLPHGYYRVSLIVWVKNGRSVERSFETGQIFGQVLVNFWGYALRNRNIWFTSLLGIAAWFNEFEKMCSLNVWSSRPIVWEKRYSEFSSRFGTVRLEQKSFSCCKNSKKVV